MTELPEREGEGGMADAESRQRERVTGILVLAAFVPLMAGALLLVSRGVKTPATLDPAVLKQIFTVPPEVFKPEPLEKVLFVCGVLLTLPLIYLLLRSLGPLVARMPGKAVAVLDPLLTLLLLGGLLLDGFLGLRNAEFWMLDDAEWNHPVLIVVSCALAGLVTWLVTGPDRDGVRSRVSRWLGITARVLAVGLILLSFSLCVFGLDSVSYNWAYTVSFETVFHGVVQVFLGKEILHDFPHQYGMYPHFLAPLFHLIGLSVAKFTVTMGLLLALAFWLLYRFLLRATSHPLVAALGFSSLVFFNFLYSRITTTEFYFQYHPLRTLFPLSAIYLAFRYFSRRDRGLYYLSFGLSSVAVLWNFETGSILFTAWMVALCFDELPTRDLRPMAAHVGRGLAVFAAVLSLFSLLLFLAYGHFPDYGRLFHFVNVFYRYGFNMLPMPLVGLWHLVLFVYVTSLIASTAAMARGDRSAFTRTLFFIAVFGIGHFSYYQGRSHDDVLIGVSWPAQIILVLLTDRLVSGMRRHRRYHDALAVSGSLAIMLLSVALLLTYRARLGERVAGVLPGIFSPSTSEMHRRAAFVASHTRPGEEVLILSYHSGIFHLASRTTSPLQLPGPPEWFLQSDIAGISRYIHDAKWEKIFFDGTYMVTRSIPIYNLITVLRSTYPAVMCSDDRTLGFVARKPPNGP